MELNIAVVNDLESDCKRIEEYIERYFSDRRNKPARVGRYYNAEDFLKTYRKGEYQIMFLDICMGEMNGLELANRIRSGDKDICIIFMSTTRDFVQCIQREDHPRQEWLTHYQEEKSRYRSEVSQKHRRAIRRLNGNRNTQSAMECQHSYV